MIFGRLYIKLTLNNTIMTLTDCKGKVLHYGSTGLLGFKGPKKTSLLSIQLLTFKIFKQIKKNNIKYLQIFIKRISQQLNPILEIFKKKDINIFIIKDITPFAHNGCRLPKKRKI